jgi:hypothetical protein
MSNFKYRCLAKKYVRGVRRLEEMRSLGCRALGEKPDATQNRRIAQRRLEAGFRGWSVFCVRCNAVVGRTSGGRRPGPALLFEQALLFR